MAVHQASLFDTEPEPWQWDADATRLVASVVLPEGPGREFDYIVPPVIQEASSAETRIEVGRRVRVPFGRGNRTVEAYCVRLDHRPVGARRLKSVLAVLDPRSLLSPAMLRLTEWIAEYYLCPWGLVLEAVVPGGVRIQAGTRKALLFSVPAETLARLAAGEIKLPAKRQSALEHLARSPRPLTLSQLTQLAGCSTGPVKALRDAGLVTATEARVPRFQVHEEPAPPRQSPLPLNADQQKSYDAIHAALDSGQHRSILIHGVTGSGKTEVYIQAIAETVRFGRQAIVLVPEISLTPQTVERFRARFDAVAVLHSHQSPVERHWQWHRIAEGEVQVVVGARSAVFAPTPNLGLVVIDEEQEGSFKQETAPRYHAREVARRRAEAEGVPLVLGSATPSLETWHRATTGEFQLVEMPQRIEARPMPAVRIVDLREQRRGQPFRGALSRLLQQAMEESLREGGKIMLLLNRRGFSTHIQCPACGTAVTCPGCDIPLTFHRKDATAICHYCDHQIPAPDVCPECQCPGIRYSGTGTQRLEAEIRARFPDAPCLRMDTDSMRKPGSHAKALAMFRDGAARILLGTQMIAKGLDFHDVTLVGVINADTALNFPDLRATERTFQLITQVAGRTGRGVAGGRVLVQTLAPDHIAIRAASRHDYQAFAAHELPHRQALGYPPFGSLVRIVVRGPRERDTKHFAESVGDRLREAVTDQGGRANVLGPAPAPFAKLRGKFRFQLLLRGPDGPALRAATRTATDDLKPPTDVQWIADVDPYDML